MDTKIHAVHLLLLASFREPFFRKHYTQFILAHFISVRNLQLKESTDSQLKESTDSSKNRLSDTIPLKKGIFY